MSMHSANQPFQQSHDEDEFEYQTNIKQGKGCFNLNNLKSYEILKSAVKNIASNTKFTLLMILCTFPFFAFMVFFEIKLPKIINFILELLVPPYTSYGTNIYSDHEGLLYFRQVGELRREHYQIILELVPFYLVLLPLLELFSLTIIIKFTSKIYAGEVESSNTLRETITETFYQKNILKGPFVTSIWVQLFSTSTLFGLIWAVANHFIITNQFSSNYYYFEFGYDSVLQKDFYVTILSIVFHAQIFVVLLYKYLDWSAFWNMGIVISVLEGKTGLDALEMSAYYRKHCKQTGFQLMLVFFAYSVVLRLPFILVRMCNYMIARVVVIVIVVGLVCLGSLVKWVALVLYFYDCKAQVLSKKADEQVSKAAKADDLC